MILIGFVISLVRSIRMASLKVSEDIKSFKSKYIEDELVGSLVLSSFFNEVEHCLENPTSLNIVLPKLGSFSYSKNKFRRFVRRLLGQRKMFKSNYSYYNSKYDSLSELNTKLLETYRYYKPLHLMHTVWLNEFYLDINYFHKVKKLSNGIKNDYASYVDSREKYFSDRFNWKVKGGNRVSGGDES